MERARLLQELRDAYSQETLEVERLRAAVHAAAEGGIDGPEVEAAWERLRAWETGSWLRSQLQAVVSGGDLVKLAAVVKQAELFVADGGFWRGRQRSQQNCSESSSLLRDIEMAKEKLATLRAEEHAEQELQLAQASGDPAKLLSALRAARGDDGGVQRSDSGDSESPAAATPAAQPPPAPAVFSPRVGRSRPQASEADLPVLLGRLPPPPPRDMAIKDSAGGDLTAKPRRRVRWADKVE